MADITIQASSIEEIVNSLHDVISSKVVVEDNKIVEVHVLAENARHAKQISRDIQSAIMSKFDLDLDHKKISVAQIDFQHETHKDSRPKIKSIRYGIEGNVTEFTVELQDGEKVHTGTAKGFNSQRNTYRLLAEATIGCLQEMLKVENIFILESIRKINLSEEEVFVVGINLVTPQQELFLSGTAVVRKDEKESIVRSVLDAVNRKITRISQ